jgi:hypothetical protein
MQYYLFKDMLFAGFQQIDRMKIICRTLQSACRLVYLLSGRRAGLNFPGYLSGNG